MKGSFMLNCAAIGTVYFNVRGSKVHTYPSLISPDSPPSLKQVSNLKSLT